MSRSSEEISRNNSTGGKPDSNISNDTLHVGGIPAEDIATQQYVRNYHDAKEALQKNYIDSEDAQVLSSAKNYTDTVVANQDFSDFAKLTDVQTLGVNLNNKINTDINNLSNSTQQSINSLGTTVDQNAQIEQSQINTINRNIGILDSNVINLQQQIQAEATARANGDNGLGNRIGSVENDVSGLSSQMQELFTSVSSGKRKVAAAITDKGVQTASDATFDTMATNIGQITTGTDTSDATATEADIMFGKTAYAQGTKRYGTHRDLDTSDADATENDILLGKTAYVNGQKIYGSYIPDGEYGYPTYGTNTSQATANPDDIAYGKTAYVGGQYVVGTGNTGIEEVYANKDYQFQQCNMKWKDDDVVSILKEAYSLNLDYMVRIVLLDANDGTKWAVESFAIDENGIYRQGTANANQEIVYKKYRYTKEELGIPAEDSYANYFIGLTAPGYGNNANRCLFILNKFVPIENSYNGKFELHFYTYHLTENGVIGQMYSSEDVINNFIYETSIENMQLASLGYVNIVAPWNKPYEFYLVYSHYSSSSSINTEVKHFNISRTLEGLYIRYTSKEFPARDYYFGHQYKITMSKDNKFIIGCMKQTYQMHYPSAYFGYIILDDYGEPLAINNSLGAYGGNIIPGTNTAIELSSYNATTYKITIYNLPYTGEAVIRPVAVKTVYLQMEEERINGTIGMSIITLSQEKILIFSDKYYSSGTTVSMPKILSVNLQDILNASNGETLTNYDTIYEFPIASQNTSYDCIVKSNFNDSKIIALVGDVINKNYVAACTFQGNNTNNLLGLNYRGAYYFRQREHLLTAGQPDVRAGKTFLGWQGYPETGTMEVE